MSFHHCISAIQAAAGRAITEDEADAIFSKAQARTRFYTSQGLTLIDAAKRTGSELGSEMRIAAQLELRNAALNVMRRQVLDARIVPGMEAESVRAVLAGSIKGAFRGAAASIDAAYHGLRNQMFGGMIADLRQANLLKVVQARDKMFERNVARELWRLNDPAAGKPSGDAHALAVATILHKYQEAVRGELNGAGAAIGKLDHYVTRQSHDQMKVRGDGSDAAFRTWRDMIAPRLDPVTYRDAENPAKLLRDIWQNLSAGIHTTSTSETLSGFKGSANLGKKVSQERVLHFRDADAWFDYNAQFGRGAVIDAVIMQVDKGSRDIALMKSLGTNPEAMFTGWTAKLAAAARDAGDFKAVDAYKNQSFNLDVLKTIDGRAAIPGKVTLAKIGSGIRHFQEMAKLGGVVLSSLPDLAVNAATLRHNGVGLMEAYAQQMIGLLPRGAATREIAEHLGAGIDTLLGEVMSRFRCEDGAIGVLGKASETFYKFTGLNHWTESLKSSAALMLSSHLASSAGTAFAELAPRLQNTLRRYGIEASEWDGIRATKARAADGRYYLMPDDVADKAAGAKLQTYFVDQMREGMTEPTAWGRTAVTWGTQRGTWEGESVRLLMQFKTYATTFMTRTIGRETMRDGLDVGGLAHLIVATTALGYLSMTLKELAKGREPRQPQTAGQYASVLGAAMVQGGGLGIYGDFLFGEANRMGGGFIGTLAGPTGGAIEDVHGFLANRLRGEGHPAAEAIQMVKNQTPFLNLFYTRAALDYLVLYRIQEWANPGYLHRYEQNVKRQNSQSFWLRPSEAAR